MTAHVYTQYRADGAVLYVGCSQSMKQRQATHRRGSPWGCMIDRVDSFEVDPSEMLEAERQAIIEARPIFNRAHNPRYAEPSVVRPKYRCPTGWLMDVAAWDDPFGTEIFKIPTKEGQADG